MVSTITFDMIICCKHKYSHALKTSRFVGDFDWNVERAVEEMKSICT
jgi:hypothetical protein